MKQQDYNCRISADVTSREAFEGICRVSEWWAKDFEGHSCDLHDIFTVRFGQTFATFKIIEVVAAKKIVWQVIDCYLHLLKDTKEWADTRIIWEISTGNNTTQIDMTHVGLVPGIECYADCKNGWDFYIKESLLQFLNQRKGLPGTGIHATISNAGRTYEGTLYSRDQPLPDLAGECLLIDVRETNFEHVIYSYAVGRLDKTTFDRQQLRGDNYMIVENRPLFEGIQPLDDLQATIKKSGYAPVNGLDMYYEIQGEGRPLVYIPMGFGVAGMTQFPTLIRSRKLISVDLQGRGRTADIDRPLSFEQQADDVVGLLQHLGVGQADFLGECVGGVVATMIAIRHPEFVGRIATYGTIFGPVQDAYKPEILEGFMSLTPGADVIRFQRESYRKVAPDPDYWARIWSKAGSIEWNGFSREELASLKSPVLVAVGDHDWVRLGHSLEAFQLIPDAQLAVIPDAGHFLLETEQQKVLPAVETFLDASVNRQPFATTKIAYQPGITR